MTPHEVTPTAKLSEPDETDTVDPRTATSASDRNILSVDEAAAYLCIPKATLYTWRTRRAGFGPQAVKFGARLRYRRADLDAWVAEHVERVSESSHSEQGVSLSRRSGPR